jgi:hypothetical protein
MRNFASRGVIKVLIATLIGVQILLGISFKFFLHVGDLVSYAQTLNENNALAIGVTNNIYQDEEDFYVWHNLEARAFLMYGEASGLTQSINAVFLQEIDGISYTRASYINDQTVKMGTYKKLVQNEIAVSSYVAGRYGLLPGDQIYIVGNSAVIKVIITYVYNDINRIIDFDPTFTTGSVLLSSEIDLGLDEIQYLHFMDVFAHAYVDIVIKEDQLHNVRIDLNRIFAFDIVTTIVLSVILFLAYFRLTLPRLNRLICKGKPEATQVWFRQSWPLVLSYLAVMCVVRVFVYQRWPYPFIFAIVLILSFGFCMKLGLSRINKQVYS